jgi:hypothetical protein
LNEVRAPIAALALRFTRRALSPGIRLVFVWHYPPY